MALPLTSRPSAVVISLTFARMVNGHYIPAKRRRAIPEIGGSQAGFIGLVVFLSLLIVVCCSAVYYLLRYHEPTDQDRAIRRERSRRRRTETGDPPSESSFGDRFRRIWERVHRGNGRSGHGWMKAGSGDTWESTPNNGNLASEESGINGGQMQSVQEHIENTVCITESPLSDSGPGHGPISAHYRDPFNEESPVSQTSPIGVEIMRSQSPLSMSSSGDEDDTHCRHSSVFSTVSGTRFIEHL
ncbi:hypothetical protein PISMIDRAFT_683667 [Pisolithus microcarpus 441]|uniref:Uncharacterized protein n=1 Tax=Pisolithus microcarpus 441 TaxID=765257 RepID=A0A0C9YYK7_9AGAM|nr:hypothetical protein BKA83DRAFT_4159665 [Pisolithus microcarpus]KIK18979.1 hypothetical protein PISMIDRAFT_683667 [Pisolithus microcarpus 441]